MKAAVLKRQIIRFNTYVPYPNGLTGRQVFEKILNLLLMASCGIGLAAVLLLMLVMS